MEIADSADSTDFEGVIGCGTYESIYGKFQHFDNRNMLTDLPGRYAWVGRVRSPSGPGARKPHIANGVASQVQPSQEWNRHKRTQRSPRDDGHRPEEHPGRVESGCQKIGP